MKPRMILILNDLFITEKQAECLMEIFNGYDVWYLA